jgi:hypothetical protein
MLRVAQTGVMKRSQKLFLYKKNLNLIIICNFYLKHFPGAKYFTKNEEKQILTMVKCIFSAQLAALQRCKE